MQRLAAIAAFAGLVAISAGVWVYTQQSATADPFAQCRTSKSAGGAEAIGGPSALVTQNGEEATAKDVSTKPNLVSRGFPVGPPVSTRTTAPPAHTASPHPHPSRLRPVAHPLVPE